MAADEFFSVHAKIYFKTAKQCPMQHAMIFRSVPEHEHNLYMGGLLTNERSTG